MMKLLFLVDAAALRELGRSLSGVEWRRWRFGPFSKDVLKTLDSLVDEGLLAVDPGPEMRYIALVEPPKIPEDVRRVVDRVIDEYGFLPLNKLLEKVYSEFHIREKGMGERIVLDMHAEILELAERVGDDEDALVELIGRIYDAYRDPLEALPRDTLVIYAIAATYLAKRDREKLKRITSRLLDLLESARLVLEKRGREPLPPELRKWINDVYRELVDVATEALKG